MHVHIHINIHIYTCIHIHIHIHIYTYTYTHTHTLHRYVSGGKGLTFYELYTYTYTYTHIHTQHRYVSRGKGLTFYELGTFVVQNGSCNCHYGFRSFWGMTNCGVQCPGISSKYLEEVCMSNICVLSVTMASAASGA